MPLGLNGFWQSKSHIWINKISLKVISRKKLTVRLEQTTSRSLVRCHIHRSTGPLDVNDVCTKQNRKWLVLPFEKSLMKWNNSEWINICSELISPFFEPLLLHLCLFCHFLVFCDTKFNVAKRVFWCTVIVPKPTKWNLYLNKDV